MVSESNVFQPILNAQLRNHKGEEKALEDVQRRTRSEQERYQNYGSADDVVRMYKDDLSSEHAKEVNAELKRLGLPVLADVRAEFLKRAGEQTAGRPRPSPERKNAKHATVAAMNARASQVSITLSANNMALFAFCLYFGATYSSR